VTSGIKLAIASLAVVLSAYFIGTVYGYGQVTARVEILQQEIVELKAIIESNFWHLWERLDD